MKPTRWFHAHEPWDDRGRGMAGRDRRRRERETAEEYLTAVQDMLEPPDEPPHPKYDDPWFPANQEPVP